MFYKLKGLLSLCTMQFFFTFFIKFTLDAGCQLPSKIAVDTRHLGLDTRHLRFEVDTRHLELDTRHLVVDTRHMGLDTRHFEVDTRYLGTRE